MNYIYGIEFRIVLMTIIIGIFIATMLYERFGLLSGGIIAPAIISLFFIRPLFIISTMILVIVLHMMISFLRNKTILYGRRLYSAILLLGVSLTIFTRIVMDGLLLLGYGLFSAEGYNVIRIPMLEFQVPEFLVSLGLGMNYYGYVIGLLITPIIVNDTQNQGLKKTITILLGVSFATFSIVSAITYLLW